jgi:hypothetical protein
VAHVVFSPLRRVKRLPQLPALLLQLTNADRFVFITPYGPISIRALIRHFPENDSSVNGEVSIGDSRGSRILMKPKPVVS